MFIDQVKISLKAGDGGNLVAFVVKCSVWWSGGEMEAKCLSSI